MGSFSVFGVPVRVDPWFFLGLFFVYSWSGGARSGVIAAVALGVLTLIHELGHALTARRFGCQVSISLNLFVGWASYSAPKPLSRRQQILISLMGPLSQLAVAWIGLGVVHQLFQRQPKTDANLPQLELLADFWQGLTWAGTVIAFLNLLPMWPLDGGHIVHNLLRSKLPERAALRVMLLGTFGLIGVIVAAGIAARDGGIGRLVDERMLTRDVYGPLFDSSLLGAIGGQLRRLPGYLLDIPWFLLMFTGMSTIQTMQALSRTDHDTGWINVERNRAPLERDPAEVEASQAEMAGWASGSLPVMPRRWTASPWLRASVAHRRGDVGGEQAALAQVVATGRRWVLPDPSNQAIAPLIAALPAILPVGDRRESLVLLDVLGHHGSAESLLNYANELYRTFGDPEVLVRAAAGLARTGHHDDSMAWLRRGMLERPDGHRMATDPAFVGLHQRMDFQQLLVHVRSLTPTRPSL